MMRTDLRAAIYCRVSDVSGGKRKNDWDSLPRQRTALHDLAKAHGMEVAAVYEEAMSGAKERPMFEAMMAQVRSGEVNAILVTTFDRLTRTEKIGEFEKLKGELRRLRCELYTYDMGRIPMDGKADSEFSTDVRAAASKFERLKIRERTLSAREATAKAGRWTGHLPPFGYRSLFDPMTGARTFEINDEQAPVVQRIFEMYLGGEGPKDIALWLQQQDIPAPRAAAWSKPAIRYMLRNCLYAGIAEWRKPHNRPNDEKSGPNIKATSTAFPPIIGLETWEKTQAEIARRQIYRRSGPGTPHPLSGIMRCNTCKRTMGFNNIWTGRYRCQINDSHPGACPTPQSYASTQCHQVVLRFLKRNLPRHVERVRRRVEEIQEEEDRGSEVDEFAHQRLKLAELERTREGIIRKIALGDLERAEVDFTLRSIGREIDELKAHLAAVDRERAPVDPGHGLADLEQLVAALAEYTEEEPDEDLRDLFESALNEVYLKRLGRDPKDRRRWEVVVQKLMLADGTWIYGGIG